MKKFILSLSLTLSISGCVSFQPMKLEVAPPTNSNLTVIDNRTPEQKETEMLSYIITNCKYGIQRLGDEWTVPDKISYLESQVAKQLPNARKLQVDNFVFYNNMQYQLREGNIYRGPIWSLFECDENTDRFTMYTPEENPERLNMIIGTLEGKLDGKPFSSRSAHIPSCPEGIKECDGLSARNNAIGSILKELISQVVKSK